MMPLDIGDMLVDREDSATLLNYLAKAAYRVKEREIAKKKLEISLQRLKKLSTKELNKHIDNLEDDIQDAMEKARLIRTRQTEEEETHKKLSQRLKKLHDKLDEYMSQQNKFSQKVEKIDNKIDEYADRKEKLESLKKDLKELQKIYTAAKRSKKYSKKEMEKAEKRIKKLKQEVKRME